MGVVLRRTPGVTRWAKWSWRAVAVLPGAAQPTGATCASEGEIAEFHAATLMLELHGAETDAYLHGLSAQVPCLYVVMRETDDAARPFDLVLITASPYEAQDYATPERKWSKRCRCPPVVIAWVRDFRRSAPRGRGLHEAPPRQESASVWLKTGSAMCGLPRWRMFTAPRARPRRSACNEPQ